MIRPVSFGAVTVSSKLDQSLPTIAGIFAYPEVQQAIANLPDKVVIAPGMSRDGRDIAVGRQGTVAQRLSIADDSGKLLPGAPYALIAVLHQQASDYFKTKAAALNEL